MNDKTLRNHVAAALDFDPHVDPAGIAVTVHNGVVTLSGHVPTLAQKLAARETAMRVKGVRAIAQELRVHPQGDAEADEDLAERAANVLDWTSALPRDAIQVEVSSGDVTLTGEVEWDYQRRIAEQEVRGLAGVLDVRNLITLQFKHPPEDIKGRIEEALSRCDLDGADVRVLVDGGDVSLTGTVRTWFDCDLVDRLAWSVAGVRSVDNRLVILDDRGGDDLVA